ncbi:MAG: transglutaminase-like domain-containing protein [Ilumatobacteraceae bacterium]
MDQRSVKSRFRELLQLSDNRLPLDELCLLISQMAGADIDVDDELRKLDVAARAIPASFDGLMTHLFQGPAAVRGNAEDYYSLSNSLLSEVHRTGLGIPITLSVLGIELGRRAGVGIVGVGMPGHFLVRSENDRDLFADPFGGGRVLDREGVRRLFANITSGRAPWSEAYFRVVSSRDIVFRILNNISVACNRSPADAVNLPWVLEFLSWFPHGEPFDPKAAERAMARYN